MAVIREWMFRTWYRFVNTIDKKAEVLFMNYGYDNPSMAVELDAMDEANRYSTQLYHLLGSAIDLKGKQIAEIGCGRGGGLYYITRAFAPASALGVDLDTTAVKFCNRQYGNNGTTFKQGDAQNLHFLPNNSLDAIINNESSHRYPRMDLFLKEVYRILKPGGFFIFADFRFEYDEAAFKKLMAESGFTIHREIDITQDVVRALDKDDARKRDLVKRLTPRFLRPIAHNFAATIGSDTYNKFLNRKYVYWHYVMQKPE